MNADERRFEEGRHPESLGRGSRFGVAGLVFVWLLVLSAPAGARENEYDVLSKMLTPFENLFTTEAGQARPGLAADLMLQAMTGSSAVMPGSTFHVAFQAPDKVFVGGPVLGTPIAACRNGKDFWAFPGAQLGAMLGSAGAPPPHGGALFLDNIVLPFPQKELVFLPVLFQVADAGDEAVDNAPCRVLDVSLLPRVAATLKVQGWSARVWVRGDYSPAKLDLSKPGWHIAILFKKIDFVPVVPASTWRPSAGQSADVAHLTAAQLAELAALAGVKIGD